MPFPILPENGQDERQFLIQDPFQLRAQIIPIFDVNRENQLLTGLGTAFRAEADNMFLTAQHILEHHAAALPAPFGEILGVLSPGLVYGLCRLPPECFIRIRQMGTLRRTLDDPLAQLRGSRETRNCFDCMKLHFVNSPRLEALNQIPLLPLSNRPLQVGDRLMAIGYPELSTAQNVDPARLPLYTERMFGAVATVTELMPEGRDATAPWPTFAVQGNWRSGMSGGPIFNEHGEVIGIVSRSYVPQDGSMGTGYGFWFEPVPNFPSWFRDRSYLA